MSELATSSQVSPINGLPALGRIFYKHFGEVAELPGADQSKRGRRGAKSRVNPLAALFAICATVVENRQFVGQYVEQTLIWQHVLDSLFRGERHHIYPCLKAISELEPPWAHYRDIEVKSKNKDDLDRAACKFYPIFLEKIRSYAVDIARYITGDEEFDPVGEQWVEIAQLVFDFFRFRYSPEWYLFVRRIVRAHDFPLEAQKEAVADWFYTDPNSWMLIHTYLAWMINGGNLHERPVRINYFPFFQEAVRLSRGDITKATEFMRTLSAEAKGIGLYTLYTTESELEPNGNLTETIHDYLYNTEISYRNFAQKLRDLVKRLGAQQLHESAPPQRAGALSSNSPPPA